MCRGVLSSVNKNLLTFFMMSPYFNTLPLHKIIFKIKIKVCSETLFRKNSYRIENSQFSHNKKTSAFEILKSSCVSKNFNSNEKMLKQITKPRQCGTLRKLFRLPPDKRFLHSYGDIKEHKDICFPRTSRMQVLDI